MRDGPSSLFRILVLALLAACSVRFLTPVGWMPGESGPRGPMLVICTGEGAQMAHLHEHPGQAPAQGAHEACPFAGFAALDAETPFALPLPGVAWVAAPKADRIAHLWRDPEPDYRRQAPRGPPALI